MNISSAALPLLILLLFSNHVYAEHTSPLLENAALRNAALSSGPTPVELKIPEAHLEIPLGFSVIKLSSAYVTLFGGGFRYYEGSTFGMGAMVYTGQISNGTTGNYTLGGLEPSIILFSHSSVRIETGLLMGAAGGTMAGGTSSGGFILNPKLAFLIPMGNAIKGAINFTYNWDTNNPAFAGPMCGLEIHFTHD